jgi:hypothetical protein
MEGGEGELVARVRVDSLEHPHPQPQEPHHRVSCVKPLPYICVGMLNIEICITATELVRVYSRMCPVCTCMSNSGERRDTSSKQNRTTNSGNHISEHGFYLMFVTACTHTHTKRERENEETVPDARTWQLHRR